MDRLFGKVRFDHFSRQHDINVTYEVHWISIPADDIRSIDSFEVSVQVFANDNLKKLPDIPRVLTLADHNGRWLYGEYYNGKFYAHETPISGLMGINVWEDYEIVKNDIRRQQETWQGLL